MRAEILEELQKMARLFEMTTDQIINFDGKILAEPLLDIKVL